MVKITATSAFPPQRWTDENNKLTPYWLPIIFSTNQNISEHINKVILEIELNFGPERWLLTNAIIMVSLFAVKLDSYAIAFEKAVTVFTHMLNEG